MRTTADIKAEILRLTREYTRLAHRSQRAGFEPEGGAPFLPGPTPGACLTKTK